MTEQAEVETMRWDQHGRAMTDYDNMAEVIAWIRLHGGEVRVEHDGSGYSRPPSIAIRQADGTEDYAAPGDEVVKGERWFWVKVDGFLNRRFREFTVRRAADTDGAET